MLLCPCGDGNPGRRHFAGPSVLSLYRRMAGTHNLDLAQVPFKERTDVSGHGQIWKYVIESGHLNPLPIAEEEKELLR